MATQLFFVTGVPTLQRATNTARLDGTATGWFPLPLSTAQGASLVSRTANTVAGATSGVEIPAGTASCEWISPPVSADVTISGTITANLWSSENSMNANVAINVVIDIIRATDTSIVNIVTSTRTTEVAITTRAVNNFTTGMTSGAYSSQTLNRGDRLRIRVFGDDAGTMGAGFTFDFAYNGATGVDGDSYVTFTETFSFEDDVNNPGGSTVYFTDTASAVSTASVDREAWTSRGAGVQTDVTNTTTGWTTPIQVTDTAGGTVVDWFTRGLAAFTLGGIAKVNLRGAQSGAGNASLGFQIAVVDNDGTNPVVWGISQYANSSTPVGNLGATEADRVIWVSGDDVSVSGNQRLRLRMYIDDSAGSAMVTALTVTTWYAGTSGGASGDSYVIFPQTLTEFTAPAFQPRPTGTFFNDPGVV